MNAGREHVDVDSTERLANMSADEVNDLPYGFLILDRSGAVQLYNRYESSMSRLSSERVVGRNWFREVAPCTRVEAFFGRFKRLVDDPEATAERFSFRFHFRHGAQDVTVQMTRGPDADGSVFMTVVRNNVTGADLPRASTVTLDDGRGALLGPTGVTFPVPAATFARLLSTATSDQVRALAAEVGRSIAELAEVDASAVGEKDLAGAPDLLRAGVLDAAFARSGFGRLALDTTAYSSAGTIGVTVRPPTTEVTPALVTFYEWLLTSVFQQALRESLVVRCLDGHDTAVLPWFFAVVAKSSAALLEDIDRVSAKVIAERLGLCVAAEE